LLGGSVWARSWVERNRRVPLARNTKSLAYKYCEWCAPRISFCVDVVSEWSKELALGASPERVAGSNPVRITFCPHKETGWRRGGEGGPQDVRKALRAARVRLVPPHGTWVVGVYRTGEIRPQKVHHTKARAEARETSGRGRERERAPKRRLRFRPRGKEKRKRKVRNTSRDSNSQSPDP
jgi:hypothetical protein